MRERTAESNDMKLPDTIEYRIGLRRSQVVERNDRALTMCQEDQFVDAFACQKVLDHRIQPAGDAVTPGVLGNGLVFCSQSSVDVPGDAGVRTVLMIDDIASNVH